MPSLKVVFDPLERQENVAVVWSHNIAAQSPRAGETALSGTVAPPVAGTGSRHWTRMPSTRIHISLGAQAGQTYQFGIVPVRHRAERLGLDGDDEPRDLLVRRHRELHLQQDEAEIPRAIRCSQEQQRGGVDR